MKSSSPSADDTLEAEYRGRYVNILEPLAVELELHVASYFRDMPRIDRISARPKGVESFVAKAKKEHDGKRLYKEPLEEIQDQIGCRIVTYYLSDVAQIDRLVTQYFRAIEQKDRVPESEWEFGYFGRHYVLFIPGEVVNPDIDRSLTPKFFELQVKTLFQHAWSEADHDLGYKPGDTPLSSEQKRRLAFTSAQAWGADDIFEALFSERKAS